MIHERLDIAHWKSVFSLPRLREEVKGKPASMQPSACIISGPYDIAVLEQLREEAFAFLPGIERVPTDIFVWSRGELERREVTKIGGLPYRKAGKPWPVAKSGTPLNFVAQFCFADSRDITPDLPGDMLLFFAEGKQWGRGDEDYDFLWGDFDERDSGVALEWVTLGDFPLITEAEIPPTKWHIMPCYGSIHRTWDYPTVDGFAYPHIIAHIPPVFEATKIGGVCPWLDMQGEMPGEYLCTISSVFPEAYKPFPFINMPEPFSTSKEWGDSHALMFGDVGLLNFYISSNGSLQWVGHSH